MMKLLEFVHRWVALVAALFIIVISLSGAALVFEDGIDRVLNPQLWRASRGPSLPLDTLAARGAAALGETVTGVVPSVVAGRAAQVRGADGTAAFLDPVTGRVLGLRTAEESNRGLARRLHLLHTSLLLAPVGGRLVAYANTAALFLVLSGIVIWWPSKVWRVRWSASWKRVNFDLHHALGIFSALVLAIVTGTGVLIHYEQLSSRALRHLDRAALPEPAPQPPAPEGTPMVPLAVVAAAADSALPGAQLMVVSISPRATAPIIAAMRFPEDRTPAGRSRVFVDRYRGTVLGVTNAREAGLGTWVTFTKRSWHTGDQLGWPMSIVWLLACLVMVWQAVSGVLMWWNARRGRRTKAARTASAAPA